MYRTCIGVWEVSPRFRHNVWPHTTFFDVIEIIMHCCFSKWCLSDIDIQCLYDHVYFSFFSSSSSFFLTSHSFIFMCMTSFFGKRRVCFLTFNSSPFIFNYVENKRFKLFFYKIKRQFKVNIFFFATARTPILR